MRKLKRGLLAFFAGEFLTLWHRDKSFQKKVKKEKDLVEKMKVIFQAMFDFNKELVDEVQKIDIKEHTELAKHFVEKEIKQLKDKMTKLEGEWKELSAIKIKPILAELEIKYNKAKLKATEFSTEIRESFELEDKIEEIKKHLEHLKRKKIS